MVMLRQAGAAGRSTTAIGGYGSPRSRGRQQWARRYSLTSSRTSERSERDPGPITTNGYVAPSGGRRPFNNRHRWLWVPAFAGTTNVRAIPPRRPGQVSAANANNHQWL